MNYNFCDYPIETRKKIREKVKHKGLLYFARVNYAFANRQEFKVAQHHRIIAKALDDVISGKTQYLMLNIAPRYGKTELVCKQFVMYGFFKNPRSRFLHLSYSDDLVQDTSKEITDTMAQPYYQELCDVHLASNGAKKWSTTAGGEFYAVSSGGQVTGFGAGRIESDDDGKFAGAIIIDDPIKAEDALSDIQRERINQRFDNTIRSRVNAKNTPIIIVMQRLHENDLCGYLLRKEPEKWRVISLPCLTYEGGDPHALWEDKHNVEQLLEMQRTIPYVFDTQYQQNPTPMEGLMYRPFRTYDVLPEGKHRIKNYTDTADTGSDALCSINYAEYEDAIYILSVLFTTKPMEYTEPETARMLTADNVEVSVIESNNGGRGFRRNVESQCRQMGNRQTSFQDLTQTQNKNVRIFSHSNEVNNLVYMPSNWEYLWSDFASAIKSYRKEGRNAHDDAPDALTGVVEQFGNGGWSFGFGDNYY